MASTVPTRNSQNEPASERSTSPAAIAVSAPPSTCASRNRADSGGPANPIAAKQSTGSEVIRPATPLETPSAVSISSSTGPTLLTAVRRLSPVSTIAVPMRTSPPVAAVLVLVGAVRVTPGMLLRGAGHPPHGEGARSRARADPADVRHDRGHAAPQGSLEREGRQRGGQDPE